MPSILALRKLKPEVIVVIGGGSNIDAAKAASVLATLGGPIDRYFGTALVTDTLRQVHPDHSRRAQDGTFDGAKGVTELWLL